MTVSVSVSLAPSVAAPQITDGTILACPVDWPPAGGRPQAVGISASPAGTSRSRVLVERSLRHLSEAGLTTELLDLALLPADALLARRRDATLEAALERVAAAEALVLGTPVYRGSYAGQLKAFFDLLPPEALRGAAVGAIATGGSTAHLLVLDHALRPLVSSLRGLSATRGVYVTDAVMPDREQVPHEVDLALRDLAAELSVLSRALVRG